MGIIENAEEAVKLVQEIDNLELYRKLVDLQNEAMELSEKLREKDKRIAQLEDVLSIKGKMVLKDMAYYMQDENGKLVDGPFCTKCFDVDHVLCRIVPAIGGMVRCQKCKVSFRNMNIKFHF